MLLIYQRYLLSDPRALPSAHSAGWFFKKLIYLLGPRLPIQRQIKHLNPSSSVSTPPPPCPPPIPPSTLGEQSPARSPVPSHWEPAASYLDSSETDTHPQQPSLAPRAPHPTGLRPPPTAAPYPPNTSPQSAPYQYSPLSCQTHN